MTEWRTCSKPGCSRGMQDVREENIIENWLRSLDLALYTQSFLDNGYDDLEICKQVGEEDLDAIGVQDTEHRSTLLQAVDHLRQHGGSHVYFILDPEYQRLHGLQCSGCSSGDTPVHVARESPPSPSPLPPDSYVVKSSPLVTFTKLQLSAILQDKLTEDSINLADYPAVNNQVCTSTCTGALLFPCHVICISIASHPLAATIGDSCCVLCALLDVASFTLLP